MSKKVLESKPKASASSDNVTETTPLVGKKDGDGERQGLTMQQTSILIAGEMAGSGVLALPRALVKTGWVGVPIIILVCLMAAFSGKRLGDCWSILEARDPEMRSRKRNPYAIIVEQSLGKAWSVVVSMAMIVTLFGASVVYLLLAAQIIEAVLLSLVPSLTICTWYLIVVGAMTPLLFFGTPKDFHLMGLLAFGSSVVACILYFIEMMSEASPFTYRYGIHGFMDFFLAMGTLMFAFGGASTFPTIQNDMADKTKFGKSLQYGFLAVLILYLLIAIGGYAVFGERVLPNVALSMAATPLTLAANVLMAIHLLAAFIIIINPVCQEVEELYNVPRDSVGWRMAVRVSIMLALLFIGESIPRFYTILALIGATTIALLTYILPSVCYLQLVNQPAAEGQAPIETPGWMKMVCYEVIALGIVGGVAASISAFGAIFSTSMAVPCYL
ncbi:amino acid transporter AVT1D-like [Spodoptera litura]|uniref:Amino acid transporter AVT1D-like n=1 Tax=Spodoptera litura TaxID=69820 RepID=A0A9J7IZM2_SPOLT|nr:amino acid transporter AVT1D-like [Spodoptera litura]XP_022832826.1 amino acid transporter AVT1D-like [Spodoptera litura]XP_022832827.1 amino acid transporter AVT1D-like [Spodoptera litura]XP_022832828.1 amino acid transporter AVT1D-like [Spodoptera litura]